MKVHIFEDVSINDVDMLKDEKKVEEVLNIQVSHKEETNELTVERRDVEEVSVPTKEQMKTTEKQKKKPGRPRKIDPKIELAVAMWADVHKTPNVKCSSSTLAGGEKVDFSESWGEEAEKTIPEEEEEVLELVYGLVSNEFSERDEPWLFHPDNPDSEGWLEANTLEELKVVTNSTMEFLDPSKPLPPGVKPLPIVLIYCRKREDSAGQRRFKCRAVVLGNLQKDNLLPNFCPVINIPGVRMLIAEAVSQAKNAEPAITLFDLSNAFLNADLLEEDGKIVVKLPKSWAERKNAQYAVLKRALYGLKISPKRWYVTIRAYLVEKLGWKESGNCLYCKTLADGTKIWMCLYVDDVVMGGGTTKQRMSEIEMIFSRFPGKLIDPVVIDTHRDDGTKTLHYDVNGVELEVNFGRRTWLLHQEKYIRKVLKKFNMEGSFPRISQPRVNPELVLKQSAPGMETAFPIRELLGALTWVSTTARPDISYDVGLLARFVGKYGATAGTVGAGKKILKFLANTLRRGLRYCPEREKEFCLRYSALVKEQAGSNEFGICKRDPTEYSKRLFVFSDASFATCPLTLRSQTGSCIYYRGVLIAYKSSRQKLVTHSTCASEFVAASDTLEFAASLDQYIHLFDVPEVGQPQLLAPLFVDNQSAIRIARADVLNNSSKHLKLRHMKVTDEQKRLFFVGTKDQQADCLTKSLGEAIFGMMVFIEGKDETGF